MKNNNLYPTYDSLDEIMSRIVAALPIKSEKELLPLLASYHNTLLNKEVLLNYMGFIDPNRLLFSTEDKERYIFVLDQSSWFKASDNWVLLYKVGKKVKFVIGN